MTKNQKQAQVLLEEFLRLHSELQEVIRKGQLLATRMTPREFYGFQETHDFQRILGLIEQLDQNPEPRLENQEEI